jgi:CRISPR-associated protein Cas2
MAIKRQLYVIAYDIADNKRRRRVATILEAKAARVQESLFEQRMSAKQADALFERLKTYCTLDDSLRLYMVPDAAVSSSRTLGGPQIAGAGRYWLV